MLNNFYSIRDIPHGTLEAIELNIQYLRESILDTLAHKANVSINDIYQNVEHLAKQIDWFCNDRHPKNGRKLTGKGLMIRKMLIKDFICLDEPYVSNSICTGCKSKYVCLTNGHVPSEVGVRLRKQIARSVRNHNISCFHSKDLNSILKADFDSNVKELNIFVNTL
jgi:hypothetical protein